jgi:hypothetical protein
MKFSDVPVLSVFRSYTSLALLVSLFLALEMPAQQTIFSDGFEGGTNLTVNGWVAADNNIEGPPAYWGVVDSAFGGTGTHGGSNKVYCAAIGYYSLLGPCCPNYRENMAATLSRTIDLTGYTNATLSFWHRLPGIEGDEFDYVQVLIDNTIVWTKDLPVSTWTKVTLSLEAFIGGSHNVQFLFISDDTIQEEGWYLDDILITDAYTPPPPPANDSFANAPLLTGAVGTITSPNGSATSEPNEPGSGFSATNSVWFKWVAITNGTVTFRTGGSTFDTILCVYTGNTVAALTPVACDDNGDTNGASLISFEAVKDVIYRISVRGAGNARGVAQLSWSQPAGVGVDMLPDISLWVSESAGYLHGWYLDRDEPLRPGRTLLRASTATINTGAGHLELHGTSTSAGVYQRIYSTDGGYRDVYAGTFTFHPGHGHLHFDNWLNFNLRQVLPSNGVGSVVAAGDKTSFAIIDLEAYNLTLPGARQQAYYGGGLTQGLSVGWGDIYSADLQDQWIDVTDVPPGRYWLEAVVDPDNHVVESNDSNNVARILIDFYPTSLVPPNDNFANATVLSGATAAVAGSSANATKEQGEPNHRTDNPGGASVWYRWTAPSNMSVTISTEGSSFDTVLGVYTGSAVNGLTPTARNDDADGRRTSRVTFNAFSGTSYRIAVDGFNGAEGSVELSVNPAWNNDFSRPVQLSGFSGSTSGSTRGATRQTGEPIHGGANGTNSIWFLWTSPTNGPFTFDTIGSGFDTLLAVYTGSAFPLTLVAESNNLDPSNTASRVTFDAVSNTTYRVAVDGFPGELSAGVVKLGWSGPVRPTIVTQPVSTNLPAGASAQFTVGVSGTAPFQYQWRRFGTNVLNDERISGSTSPTLTIGKIYATDAGSYSVIISNVWGSVTSTPANLIVLDNPRVIYVNHHTAPLGGAVTVPIHMQAVGNEGAFNFSIQFDPALVNNPRVATGSNSVGATLTLNSTQLGGGRLGVTLTLPPGQTLPASSTLEIARVTFDAVPGATSGSMTVVGFDNLPVARSVLSTNGAPLVALFVAGSVTLENWTATASGQIMGNGSFQLSLVGPPSHTYIIEATTNLTNPSWLPVSTNQTSAGGLLQFLDPDTANHPYRFFRARMVQ